MHDARMMHKRKKNKQNLIAVTARPEGVEEEQEERRPPPAPLPRR
jgi:hypothetical protein